MSWVQDEFGTFGPMIKAKRSFESAAHLLNVINRINKIGLLAIRLSSQVIQGKGVRPTDLTP